MPLPSQGAILDSASRNPAVPDPHLVRIRDLIYQVCGIFHPDNKMNFLRDRCLRRIKARQVDSFRDYIELLTARAGRDEEIRSLLNEITVGETCFFRCPPQLAAVRKILLPRIAASRPSGVHRKIRVWSAACSTGEEPYTLAMISLEEANAACKGLAWEILATDLNDRSLARAESGVYDAYALRNTEPQIRQKYFSQDGDKFRISPEVRSRVTFSRLNLLDESKLLFMKGFDIIFCANVLIYFDTASKRRVVGHLYNSLIPGGHFFLSSTESLFSISSQFHLVHFPGATGYLRPLADSPSSHSAPALLSGGKP
ncbi:MAG TPA: protein-glutamate O-methyltransferase CheR [Verrucomicrobiae bacterium]|nr:protein-glutamate O-methyltransferase CheR [Verrucomicrobiae bacterium]